VDVSGHPSKRTRGQEVCLVGEDQGVVAPPGGGRRRGAGGEVLRWHGSAHGEGAEPRGKKRGKEVEEVRHNTVKTTARSRKVEGGRGGQIWRETLAAGVGEEGHRWRNSAPRLDCLHQVEEEVEAHLWVSSEGRGKVGSGGAMAGSGGAVRRLSAGSWRGRKKGKEKESVGEGKGEGVVVQEARGEGGR
jgi:hypothetical protein